MLQGESHFSICFNSVHKLLVLTKPDFDCVLFLLPGSPVTKSCKMEEIKIEKKVFILEWQSFWVSVAETLNCQ